MPTIHLLEAAMEFSDSLGQFETDIDKVLAKKPDVLGLTEVGRRQKAMLRACKKHGYRLVHPYYPADKYPGRANRRVGDALLIRVDHQLIAHDWIPAIPPKDAPLSQGGHEPRGYTWARIKVGDETIWVAQFHFLTRGRPGTAGQDSVRTAQNEKMIKLGAAHAKREGKGSKLAFLMGDSNIPARTLDIPGMTSIWQERKVKGDICTILSLDIDGRVSANRVRRYSGFNSNHQPISAWYDVDPKPTATKTTTARAKLVAAPEPAPEAGAAPLTPLGDLPPAKKATRKDPAKRPVSKKAPVKKTTAKKTTTKK